MASKLAKLAAGALLLASQAAERKIKRAIEIGAADAAEHATKERDRERAGAVLALLVGASRRMVPDLTAAILGGRTAAREAARRRLLAELKASGVGPPPAVWPFAQRSDDDIRAHAAAESLAVQWRGVAAANAAGAIRREESGAAAIRKTTQAMGARVRRTAVTESSQAYGDEHAQAIRDMVAQDERFGDGSWAAAARGLMREWSALLDACPACWPHDGERVGLDEQFSGGDEPGSVHAHCRCTELLVPA